MLWEQPTQYASISDIGCRRRNNQDSCLVQMCSDYEVWSARGHLFMVADGMGGHAVGELASKMAVDTVPHTFFKLKDASTRDALKRAIETANATIHDRGIQNRDFLRMGTTCTTVVLSRDGAVIGHVGDSRAYRIRDDRIDQLTFDHSLQWELLKQGKLSPEEIFLNHPRNVITRSLGPQETVQVDIEGPYVIFPGDTFVICSDGLTGHLKDSEIGMIAGHLPVAEACRMLVHLANLRGGSDNITVVAARVGEIPSGATADRASADIKPDDSNAWWRLVAGWGLAATLFAGVTATLLDYWLPGGILIGIALIIVGALLSQWRRSRVANSANSQLGETIYSRSYRTAPAKLNPKFLSQLASLEASLQRSALDEGWSIDWSRHESAFGKAKTAIAAEQYDIALREYAHAIDALMVGLHSQRKQNDQQARWGKSTSTPPHERETPPP